MNLIKLLTAESQQNISLYKLIENFYDLLKTPNWIMDYIFWELELFKILGYDLNFNDLVEKKEINNEIKYVSKSSSEKKIVPSFLVNKTKNNEDLSTLLSGLKLVGDYLEKTILKPNNLNQPISRIQFIETLK